MIPYTCHHSLLNVLIYTDCRIKLNRKQKITNFVTIWYGMNLVGFTSRELDRFSIGLKNMQTLKLILKFLLMAIYMNCETCPKIIGLE